LPHNVDTCHPIKKNSKIILVFLTKKKANKIKTWEKQQQSADIKRSYTIPCVCVSETTKRVKERKRVEKVQSKSIGKMCFPYEAVRKVKNENRFSTKIWIKQLNFVPSIHLPTPRGSRER
jgi:hypothetical protein